MFIAGLPASGKSVLVRETARLAAASGRVAHLLRWDVARLPFDTPAVLARYPEIGGVTHAVIRVATGRWARAAVLRWDRAHPDPEHVLVGETPLIGERLMELARPRDDDVEPLLASARTVFIVPVPTREIRALIEAARASDVAEARDAKSAPPDLVRSHWTDIERVAAALGIAPGGPAGRYDPDVYAAAYERILRHRHVAVAPVTQVLHGDPPRPSARELVPSADEVAEAMRDAERIAPAEVDRIAREWYLA